MWFHGYSLGGWTLAFGGIGVLWNMYTWWRDITREATFEGWHTNMVQVGMRYGMMLFICSEVMFFFAFFLGILPFKLKPNPRNWRSLAAKRYRGIKCLGSSTT